MRRTLPGINLELSTSVARVARLYEQVPEERRPDVTGERWSQLEAEVDAACGSGDGHRASAAIAAWEQHARRVLGALA